MSTFAGGAERWQATSHPAVILAGALFIVLSKIAGGLLCLGSGWRMWAARGRDAAGFMRAKTWAIGGCALIVFMLFTGFLTIGEGWFEMWRSDALREQSAEAAFRFGAMIALIALFIGTRDD